LPEAGPDAVEVRAPRNDREWEAYFDLRWRQLREPWRQPRGSERDDREAEAVHRLAIDNDGRVIGVGRLHGVDGHTGQIRYMAVAPSHRGQGVGTQILAALENAARQAQMHRIRLHAREMAAPFYRHRGYRSLSPSHVLYGEIRHFLMEKRLD
jgi:N-acetylglutamate synthase-like GNAT family acetyltransferase